MRVERELLAAARMSPDPDDYRRRFPEDTEVVDAVFGERVGTPTESHRIGKQADPDADPTLSYVVVKAGGMVESLRERIMSDWTLRSRQGQSFRIVTS